MKTSIIKLIVIPFILALVFVSCNKDDLNYDAPNVPRAGFMMINAYPNTPAVIHKADNNYIQSMNASLAYKNINFAYLYPGNRKIQTLDNNNRVLLDSTYTIQDSLLYTSIIYNKPNNKLGQILASDTLLNNLGNKTAIRFYNLANNNVTTNLSTNGEIKFENRIYDGFNSSENIQKSKFIIIDNGNQKIEVKNTDNTLLASKDVNFKSNFYYTIILLKDSQSDNYELLIYDQYKN